MSVISEFFTFGRKRRVYLDYAAATPVSDGVFRAMGPYWSQHFANPGAIHEEGVYVSNVVDEARERCGKILKTPSDTITFTSGGTEGNNLALMGVVHFALNDGRAPADIEVITTDVEHPSILETLKKLERVGVVVVNTPVGENGRIDIAELKKRITKKTLLISISYVNSEVGTIEDVKRVTHAVRTYKKDHGEQQLYVHLDAAQAPLWAPCHVDSLGIDSMSLDAGKMYGPKGVGALVHKREVKIAAITFGGGQESELRPGTENVPLIVGFGEALLRAQEKHAARSELVEKVRDYAIEKLEKEIEGARLNGPRDQRAPNNINISIDGVDGEFAVVALDEGGIAASTKSACGGKKGGGSYVVRALYGDDARASETIRFTLGEESTKSDIDTMLKVLKAHVELVRSSK